MPSLPEGQGMTLVERKEQEAHRTLMSALVRRRRQLLTVEDARLLIALRELRLSQPEQAIWRSPLERRRMGL